MFTVTDASITTLKNIMVSPSGRPATGRVGNDYEWDSIVYTAVPGTGNFVVSAVVNGGSVLGKRKVFYTYS